MKRVALVKFVRGSFDTEYSYFTYIEDLKRNDLVLVQANGSYSLAIFKRYTSNKIHEKKAEKWLIKNLQPVVTEFECDFLLGNYD